MFQEVLAVVRPSVLLIEEAAEILEPQVIACLPDSLQQTGPL